RFTFYNLTQGIYYVVMNVPGFKPVRQRVDVTSFNAGGNISIVLEALDTLAPPKASPLAGGSSSIDVAQLVRPERLLKHLDEAEKKFRKGNVIDARNRLESLVSGNPDFYDAHFLLGTVYQRDA